MKYISPKTSTRHLLRDNYVYDKRYNDVLMYSEHGYCMICGDINSRSGCLQDYIEYDDIGNINSVLYDTTCEPTSRGELRLLGAPGWNLERGPISNEEKGEKHIFWDYLRILFIPMT